MEATVLKRTGMCEEEAFRKMPPPWNKLLLSLIKKQEHRRHDDKKSVDLPQRINHLSDKALRFNSVTLGTKSQCVFQIIVPADLEHRKEKQKGAHTHPGAVQDLHTQSLVIIPLS